MARDPSGVGAAALRGAGHRAGPGTRVYALLGNPVDHSRSPGMHNAAFGAAGLDAVYVALPARTEDVPHLMRSLARAGGGGNVTLPFKTAAAAALDRPSDAVRATGACNTFWWADGALHGDNTDVAGFLAAARTLLPELAGVRALVLGAGGAARAAVHGLLSAGAAEVVVANRTQARAERLVAEMPAGADGTARVANPDDAEPDTRYDLVVNATSVGLRGEDPLPLRPLAGVHGALLDLVYRPGGTPWTRAGEALGIPAAEGTEMLLRQGAAAFTLWTGLAAPLDAMRRGLTTGGPAAS